MENVIITIARQHGGDHHLVFWRGVFRAELEMSLELNQALYDAVAI